MLLVFGLYYAVPRINRIDLICLTLSFDPLPTNFIELEILFYL